MTDWDSMSDAEIMAALDRMLTHLRAAHEAEVIGDLERDWASIPAYSWPPAPGTAHPWYEDRAAGIRSIMATGAHQVCTPGPQKPFKYWLTEPEPDLAYPSFNTIYLDVKRVVGPAPYVGEPFFYMWKVAVDQQRRWVAGDSWLEFISDRMETP